MEGLEEDLVDFDELNALGVGDGLLRRLFIGFSPRFPLSRSVGSLILNLGMRFPFSRCPISALECSFRGGAGGGAGRPSFPRAALVFALVLWDRFFWDAALARWPNSALERNFLRRRGVGSGSGACTCTASPSSRD